MKLSELIDKAIRMKAKYGDLECHYDGYLSKNLDFSAFNITNDEMVAGFYTTSWGCEFDPEYDELDDE